MKRNHLKLWCAVGGAVLAVVLAFVLSGGWLQYHICQLFGVDALPPQSQYTMVTYSEYTSDRTTFPLEYRGGAMRGDIGTVTVELPYVTFDVGDNELPLGETDAQLAGVGNVADRFAGFADSREQLIRFGCTDLFVTCYRNGTYLLCGVKEGEIYCLPMWERIHGMEYWFSHFADPILRSKAEAAMEQWDKAYKQDEDKMNNRHLWPNMLFIRTFEEGPPNGGADENWLFSPAKNDWSNAYHPADVMEEE